MPYFKDKTSALHFLDDVSFMRLLPEGCVEITEGEADALRGQEEPTAAALAQDRIAQMEREQLLPRGTREALLALTRSVAEMRGVTETQLYTENIAYRKIKDFDSQIAALREQL